MTNHSRSPNTLDTFKAILIPMCSQNTDSISSLKSGCRCPVEGAPNDSLPSHRKKWAHKYTSSSADQAAFFAGACGTSLHSQRSSILVPPIERTVIYMARRGCPISPNVEGFLRSAATPRGGIDHL